MFQFLANLFAHPALLGGTVAGAIPIVIHLLNRQHFRKVIWAAMHWLWASYKKSRRRLQLEQLILLLIRVLILVLLAAALARPVLEEGASMLTGRSAVHRVIVLDNSYSMGQLVGGKPLFEKAKQLAVDLAEKMSLSDEVDVLLANASGEDLIATSSSPRQDILNQIKGATLSDGGTNIPKSIAAACRLLNDSKSRYRREVILITDQTRAGWEQLDHQPRRVSGDDEGAIAKAFSDSRGKPRIAVARLPGDKDAENLAAVQVEVEEKVVPARVDIQLIGTVASFSRAPSRNVKVKLKVDGEEVASEVIASLSSEKPGTVTFYHSFPEAGSHAVGIELESDALPADNTAFMALDVEDQMRVLCVDGQQRVGPNASEMDYFRQALSPTKAEEIKAGKMPLYPEVISDSAFPEANLDNYRLVVLGNVPLIPKEKVQALEHFVKRGGSLWIFTGERIDPAIYNKELANLLPMVLGEVVGSGNPDDPHRDALSDTEISHPAIAKFKGIKGLPLSHLYTYRRFRFMPWLQADPTVRTVLAYENGEPAAVEKTVAPGNGRVLLVGTTADKAWNNWPTKNQYMPLMNFLALDLIQPAHAERNRTVGERFILQLPRQDLGATRREGLRLTGPNGESSSMEILTEQSIAESGTIRRAGVYTTELPGDRRRVVQFAANRNTEESDLTGIEDNEIQFNLAGENVAPSARGGYFGSLVTRSDLLLPAPEAKVVEDAMKKSGGSREFWRWLVAAVLALLVVESVLARRFGDFSR
ncbi:MAG: VWA domain-containing protein [Planctomycetota bacterium]|nr:VWA domain-containing protein [Planctomycetota bacterium]